MFFKKAVDDATSEWAQHHAKRFIDTKAKVGWWGVGMVCVSGWAGAPHGTLQGRCPCV
jgi:hypothetical protein